MDRGVFSTRGDCCVMIVTPHHTPVQQSSARQIAAETWTSSAQLLLQWLHTKTSWSPSFLYPIFCLIIFLWIISISSPSSSLLPSFSSFSVCPLQISYFPSRFFTSSSFSPALFWDLMYKTLHVPDIRLKRVHDRWTDLWRNWHITLHIYRVFVSSLWTHHENRGNQWKMNYKMLN